MKFGEIAAVERRRQDGAWVKDVPGDFPGLALKVRGNGNTHQMALSAELWAAVPAADRIKPEKEVEIEKRLLVETILLDWNIEDRPFDRDAAAEAVESSAFRQSVVRASVIVATQGAETLEADAKN